MPYTPLTVPQDRWTPPFRLNGIDYTGALIIRKGTPKRVLEIVKDLSLETFINRFRIYADRSSTRGIIRDNGTNFAGASPLVTNILKELALAVQQMLESRHCCCLLVTLAKWIHKGDDCSGEELLKKSASSVEDHPG